MSWLPLRLLVLFLLSVTLVHGEDSVLTLEQCQQIALDSNPMARAAREGVAIAEESVGVAQGTYYPDLFFRAGYSRWRRHIFLPQGFAPFPIPQTVGPVNDWVFTFNSRYLLFDWGERRAQLDAAIAEQGVACAEARRIEQEILVNVSVAYYTLIADLTLLNVANEKVNRAQDHVAISEKRYEVGDAPKVDLYRTQVEKATAKQALVQATSRVRISLGNLNTSMGLPPEIALTIDQVAPPIESPKNYDINGAMNSAEAYRPEVRRAQKRIDVAKQGIVEAQSAYGPKLHAEGEYGRHDAVFFPKDREWLIGLSFEWPLFKGFARGHALTRAERQMCLQLAELERLVLNVRQEVWNAYARLLEAYEMLQTTESQVFHAQESLRLTEQRYLVGASTVNELLDTETDLDQAQATQVEAHWNYHTALTQFLWAQGIL